MGWVGGGMQGRRSHALTESLELESIVQADAIGQVHTLKSGCRKTQAAWAHVFQQAILGPGPTTRCTKPSTRASVGGCCSNAVQEAGGMRAQSGTHLSIPPWLLQ